MGSFGKTLDFCEQTWFLENMVFFSRLWVFEAGTQNNDTGLQAQNVASDQQ